MPDIAKLIDHTFLKAAGEADAVRRLCREAREYGFASVCVNPCEVANVAGELAGSGVKTCTVVGFPLGQNSFNTKKVEAQGAIANGADELDFVMNLRLLKYAPDDCMSELECLADFCRSARADLVLKLIIECCYLTDDEKRLACRLANKAGFDFVKTSTGFGSGGATVRDVKLMRKAVGPKMGVKAAGGIRTREDALAMITAGATRLGCSAGVSIVS